ncbi:uncharacterized protein G2W53_035902 [Senna tora]|uniref:Uncharacterized protein n=1 Tax=Senna tora TaxID=362788 RepID=A0A834T462_9FABA|nr:uncharacterized protein G2W53_035902 [Senna tora]
MCVYIVERKKGIYVKVKFGWRIKKALNLVGMFGRTQKKEDGIEAHNKM